MDVSLVRITKIIAVWDIRTSYAMMRIVASQPPVPCASISHCCQTLSSCSVTRTSSSTPSATPYPSPSSHLFAGGDDRKLRSPYHRRTRLSYIASLLPDRSRSGSVNRDSQSACAAVWHASAEYWSQVFRGREARGRRERIQIST